MKKWRSFWQRSLALRVVATTTILSLAVIVLLGGALITRITDGLVKSKMEAALAEAASASVQAQTRLGAVDRDDPLAVSAVIDQIVVLLSSSGSSAGRNEVALLREPTTAPPPISLDRASNDLLPSSIPDSLRDAVRTSTRQAWTYFTIKYQSGAQEPGLVVGSPLTVPGAGQYELYLIFPLTPEQSTVNLVRRALLAVGSLLILLIAAVAWLVVRQVVRPIRMASGIAERLAAGELEQRLEIRGQDEIARLAASFNEMADSLQRQIVTLENLSQVQQRFVADVSHELRNPLMTVRMAADTVHESTTGQEPAIARSSQILQTQLGRFEALLSDLLEISRFDAGAAQLNLNPVDIREVVRASVETLRPLAAERGSELNIKSDGGEFAITIDSRRISRILRNLVANAIDHGDGKPIEIVITSGPSEVSVDVIDHGAGLRNDELAHVFDRFWRGDPSRARKTGGTGLGLAIALEDARLHRGHLEVVNREGAGAQFTLRLPRDVS